MNSLESGNIPNSSLHDEILIRKLLLSHDPDGRRLDSEMLLCAVENIMFHATISEVSGTSVDANVRSHIGDIELIGSQETLMLTICKVANQMLCQCPGQGDLHTSAMILFDVLRNYRWDAKVALALAAFVTCFGEFCLIMQLQPHIPLAVSISNFKQLPSSMSMLKPQLKALRLLVKTMVNLTKCIIEFEDLRVVHDGPDSENLAAMKSEICITAYWIIRSTLTGCSQIANMKAMKSEQLLSRDSSITIAAWELLSLDYRLSSIYNNLRQQLDAFHQQTEAKLHQKFLNLFNESPVDNQEVLQILFSLKDDLPLKNGPSQAKLGVSDLKSKVVLLLVSKPELLPSEQLFFLVHQTYDHPHRNKVEGSYEMIWFPISFSETWTDAEEKWFNFLSKSIPFYSVRKPWSMNSAVISFMKQEWNFGDEAIMVVLSSEGMITNLNALDMVFIWGSEAFPFSHLRENELWSGELWTMQLMTNDIHPILTQWVEEERNICIYGGENLDWIREFSAKMKAIKDAGVQFEMIYVGKNNLNEHVKDLLTTISGEIHSNLLSFTEIQLFWLRLESMRRSISRQGNTAATDHILEEVLALLHDNGENGWAVFGKGSLTDNVRVEGAKIIECLNLFQQWGENVIQLEFIGALRTVLEPTLVEGPCNHTEVVPYSEDFIEESLVCQKCKRFMKRFTIYE